MRRALVPLAILLISAPAQSQTELRPGVRLRVQAPGVVAGEVVGTLISRSADSVVIASDDLAPLAIPFGRLTSLEISRGRSHGAGAMRGLWWGVGVGVVLGVATVSELRDCRSVSGVRTCGTDVPAGEKSGYIIGVTAGSAFYGALIGALFPVEHWDRFDVAPHVAMELRSGKPTISWSAKF